MASYTVAMTGRAARWYGVSLVERLAEAGHDVALVVSRTA
jgi:3-polyprenyl-4-hydroxybenzoate decarboxylase